MLLHLSKFLLGAAWIGLLAFGVPAVKAGAPCVEAVFFDLGNTLIEDPGNGIFVLRPGAAQTIADLQALDVRLGIITNVPAGWDIDDLRALLEEPEFLDEFEVVILSSEAPAPKPNPAIYTFAHEALALPRPSITSTAFVGETLLEIANAEENPTLGARSVGMVGIHLSDGAPSPRADYTIPTDELGQVVDIVEDTCSAASVEDPLSGSSRLLASPRPNPSQGETRIEFAISQDEHVRIEVFDAAGRRIVSLVDRIVSAGRHEVLWDGLTADGAIAPSGIYYSRLSAGGEAHQVKILKIR